MQGADLLLNIEVHHHGGLTPVRDCCQLATVLSPSTIDGMAVYELIFVVDYIGALGDPRVDRVEAEFDAVFDPHGDLCLATITVEAADARSAAASGVRCLREAGFSVLRSYPDLVTRAEIAERFDVTRQVVGNWVRGERQSGIAFPIPAHLAANGLWLWGDVVAWHRATGDGTGGVVLRYPAVEDHVAIDADIFTPARQAVSPAKSTAGR